MESKILKHTQQQMNRNSDSDDESDDYEQALANVTIS